MLRKAPPKGHLFVRLNRVKGRPRDPPLFRLSLVGRLDDVLTSAVLARVPAEAVAPKHRPALAKVEIDLRNKIWLAQSRRATQLGVA